MIRGHLAPGEVYLHGHAESAPHGQDLVCAAVTALVCAYAGYLQQLADRDALEAPPQILLEPGKARLSARAKPGHTEALRGAYQMLLSGITQIQTAYPECVEVRWKAGECKI